MGVVNSRRMRWAGHVGCMGKWRGVYRGLVWKHRCGWEDNIMIDLQEVGGGCGAWMELAWYRVR